MEDVPQEPTQEPQPVKKKSGRPKGSKDGRAAKERKRDRLIVDLHTKNVPAGVIAKTVGCAESTVWSRIKTLRENLKSLDKLKEWQENKPDILAATQFEMVQSMLEPGKLKKASVNNLAYAFDKLHQAERLERGLSTSNVQQQQFTRVELVNYSEDK